MKISEGVPEEFADTLRNCSRGQIRRVSRLGLELAPGLDREAQTQLVCRLAQEAGQSAWKGESIIAWLGDALAYGGGQDLGHIREYATVARVSYGSLRNAKLVCGRIPVSCRRDNLSWSHHCEVGMAWTDQETIQTWLRRAEDEKISCGELRRLIRSAKQEGSASSAPASPPSNKGLELIRELRLVDRRLRRDERAWRHWSHEAFVAAAKELAALMEFVAVLNSKAVVSAEG